MSQLSIKPRAIMFYGDTGAGKTSQAYHLAKWVLNKYPGTKFRMIGSSASDLAPYQDSGMLDDGRIDYFDISNRELALADIRRLKDGYWPRDVGKGEPVGNKNYFKTDDNCKTTPKQWEKISGYIIEGLTGVNNILQNHMRGQQEGVGFKLAYAYEEDGYIFGGLDAGHIKLLQNELYKIFSQGFFCLPVRYVIVTGLVGRGDSDYKTQKGERGKVLNSAEPIYGPKAAGQAITAEVPSWFSDCFHIDREILTETIKDPNSPSGVTQREVEARVAWFVRHADKDTTIDYLARMRILPELYPKILEKFPNGYVKLGFKKGIDRFYEEYEKIVEEYQKGLKEQKE